RERDATEMQHQLQPGSRPIGGPLVSAVCEESLRRLGVGELLGAVGGVLDLIRQPEDNVVVVYDGVRRHRPKAGSDLIEEADLCAERHTGTIGTGVRSCPPRFDVGRRSYRRSRLTIARVRYSWRDMSMLRGA